MKKKMFFLTIMILILCLTIANSVIANDTQKVVWIKINFNIQKSVNLVQDWIDKNPDKRIISITSDSLGGFGNQVGWLIIYTDKNKEKDGCSR